MSLVDYLKPLERVGFVLFTKHGAVAAYGTLASTAIVVKGCVMQAAKFLLFSYCLTVLRLEGVNSGCDLLNEAAID
jgi:hypothetical protein